MNNKSLLTIRANNLSTNHYTYLHRQISCLEFYCQIFETIFKSELIYEINQRAITPNFIRRRHSVNSVLSKFILPFQTIPRLISILFTKLRFRIENFGENLLHRETNLGFFQLGASQINHPSSEHCDAVLSVSRPPGNLRGIQKFFKTFSKARINKSPTIFIRQQ